MEDNDGNQLMREGERSPLCVHCAVTVGLAWLMHRTPDGAAGVNGGFSELGNWTVEVRAWQDRGRPGSGLATKKDRTVVSARDLLKVWLKMHVENRDM